MTEIRLRTELRETETRLRTELRYEIREEGSTTRRHFDVVAESLRDDIRIIAEGLIALDGKVEAMRGLSEPSRNCLAIETSARR